jgi:hypothetical protein
MQVSLAFEAEANVGGILQAEWEPKDVLGTAAKAEVGAVTEFVCVCHCSVREGGV